PEKARGKGLISKKEETLKVGEIYAGEQNIYKFLKVGEPGVPTEVEIVGKVDTERLWGYYDYKMNVIVGESYVKEHPKLFDGAATGYFTCTDANAFYDAVEKQNLVGLNMVNFDQIYQITRLVKILVYLFMIGFLFLVATIGTTNVINAVNSNMEMRASEFAKLRAVGMTRKQFQGMILTEGGFIAAKGLFWGYLFGCGIYYVLHSMFAKSADILFMDPMYRMSLRFRLPIGYMLASGLVVVGLIYCVLKLHVKRAEKRNVIETIRNENL
ncbi:MAG: ABC transporter permease, partial [Lachnospiraceae bacterium]|nr:ABC transporter permease [Lachnospiraceae bacterium]